MSLLLFILLLICGLVIARLYAKVSTLRASILKAQEGATAAWEDAAHRSNAIAEKIGIDEQEAAELLAEMASSVLAKSDIWDVDVPYGRWGVFPSEDGSPSPLLRGFWLQCASRIFGVKMPIGSHYDWHHHPWVEILVGVVGMVVIQYEVNGNIETVELKKNVVVYIPENISHCVLTASKDSEFVCIWGEKK